MTTPGGGALTTDFDLMTAVAGKTTPATRRSARCCSRSSAG